MVHYKYNSEILTEKKENDLVLVFWHLVSFSLLCFLPQYFSKQVYLDGKPTHKHTHTEPAHCRHAKPVNNYSIFFFRWVFFFNLCTKSIHQQTGKAAIKEENKKGQRNSALIFLWHLCFNRFQSLIISRQSEMTIWQIFHPDEKVIYFRGKCKIKTNSFPPHTTERPRSMQNNDWTHPIQLTTTYSSPQATGLLAEEENALNSINSLTWLEVRGSVVLPVHPVHASTGAKTSPGWCWTKARAPTSIQGGTRAPAERINPHTASQA